MHLQANVSNFPNDLFRLTQLFRSDGVEIIGVGIAFIIGTCYLEGILAAQGNLVFLVTPERQTYHHIRESVTGNLDQTIGCTKRRQTLIKKPQSGPCTVLVHHQSG